IELGHEATLPEFAHSSLSSAAKDVDLHGSAQIQSYLNLTVGAYCYGGASYSDDRFGTTALAEPATLDESVFQLDKLSVAAVLRGLFTTAGYVANEGCANSSHKVRFVGLLSHSVSLLKQVQLLLLAFGIKCRIKNGMAFPQETEEFRLFQLQIEGGKFSQI